MIRWLFSRRKLARSIDPWDLDRPVLSWSERDNWSLRSSYAGTLITGRSGAGKSSGPGACLAKSLLATGAGALVLVVKHDETRTWQSYARAVGRERDVRVFGSGEGLRFNALAHEATRPGVGAGHTENLVRLLGTLSEVFSRGTGGGKQVDREPFWRHATDQLVRNAVDLSLLATRGVTVDTLYKIVTTAATSREHVQSADWRKNSFCFQMLELADRQSHTPDRRHDLGVVADFFMLEWPQLSDRTRSVVHSGFSAMLDVMHRGFLRTMFCGATNITPAAIEDGAIIIVDIPVKEYGEIGQIAQVIWKHAFQRHMERRNVEANPRPVVLWIDESQHTVTSGDAMWQTTARSSRVATVLLTQSLPVFESALGGDDKARAETAALFGNLSTKVLCGNSEARTNEWAATMIGRSKQLLLNSSHSYSQADWTSTVLGLPLPGRGTAGLSEAWEFELQPSAFSLLRTGGPDNGMLVDAVVYEDGRRFAATGRNYLHTTFAQSP